MNLVILPALGSSILFLIAVIAAPFRQVDALIC